jgi:hypothetical protein
MEPALVEKLDRADAGAQTLERFIAAFGKTLNPPILYHSGKEHYGFRFGAPDVRHFCLLKAVRALSAWRAAALLARQGYAQEVFVLLRTLDEFTTHIDYVLVGREEDGTPTKEAAAYLQAFFADFARNDVSDYGKIKLKQGDVHKAVGALFDAGKDGLADPTERIGCFRTSIAHSPTMSMAAILRSWICMAATRRDGTRAGCWERQRKPRPSNLSRPVSEQSPSPCV